MLTPYSSPVASCRTQTEIKKSLFIADIIPVHTTDDVESALAAIKKEFKDASSLLCVPAGNDADS